MDVEERFKDSGDNRCQNYRKTWFLGKNKIDEQAEIQVLRYASSEHEREAIWFMCLACVQRKGFFLDCMERDCREGQ